MKKVTAAFILFLGISNVPANLWGLEVNSDPGRKGVSELFRIKGCEDADLVALTGQSGGLFKNFPTDIKPLDEPKLAGGLVVLSKLRNSSNEVSGFASEMEFLLSDTEGIYSKSDWTLKIPGRGSLFATQEERFKKLFEEIEDMKKKGEKERHFNPPLSIATTVPGTGIVIGGTGEFSGSSGSFREIDEFKFISLSAGSICVDITLEVNFSKAQGKK